MELLLSFLKTLPEYNIVLDALRASECAAVTGIGQINRNHMIAALHGDTDRPLVIICQDDLAAKRLQEELKAFLNTEVQMLPHRELTLYDSAAVSRGWEQKRLRQLFDLAEGKTRIQIISWNALSQRTMPPVVLRSAAFRLTVGQDYSLDDLL